MEAITQYVHTYIYCSSLSLQHDDILTLLININFDDLELQLFWVGGAVDESPISLLQCAVALPNSVLFGSIQAHV